MSPRRLLGILLIASSLSVVCGILASSVVFQIWGLERKAPFRALYEPGRTDMWKPVSQYMLCSSIQWLMEVQSRTVEEQVRSLAEGKVSREVREATKLNEQAKQLEQAGQTSEAQNLRLRAEQALQRARDFERQAERISGPWREVVYQDEKKVERRYYITRYYTLIAIPVLVLWFAIWIVAAYLPHEVRQTNEIVKIGAIIGLFQGVTLGLLVVLWSFLGGQSLQEFYGNGKFYHGQWTGLSLFPVTGVILTGYLFGTLAGLLAKAVELLRYALLGGLIEGTSKSA
jgi:hypothetical protein